MSSLDGSPTGLICMESLKEPSLAEIYNDYWSFQHQNSMVQYVSIRTHSQPVKKQHYFASTWNVVSTSIYDGSS